jgi:cobalt-zinc-cadmium efflux system membrane fusion protein
MLAGLMLSACGEGKKPEAAAAPSGPPTVELSDKQLDLVKVEAAGMQPFADTQSAVGSIDFDEDRSVQVFSNYQGKIIQALAQLGDPVRKGQPLYTIESPDLMQAESTLIAAAGVLDLTNHALTRAQHLYGQQGVAQKDLEQAQSDQMTAEAAYKSARLAVKVFGKTDAEIDHMVAARAVDPTLVVRSPMSGVVTARNAQPGLLVQPGSAPAPYAVADLSTMWMLAQATEADAAQFHVGQPVEVSVMALPGRTFTGKIETIAPSVDPNVHTLQMRASIPNPDRALKASMLANFVIHTSASVQGVALPPASVVREADGTMTAWVTTDRRRFTQRVVSVGMQTTSYDQIVGGLKPGELVVSTGAVFLDNMLSTTPDD